MAEFKINFRGIRKRKNSGVVSRGLSKASYMLQETLGDFRTFHEGSGISGAVGSSIGISEK